MRIFQICFAVNISNILIILPGTHRNNFICVSLTTIHFFSLQKLKFKVLKNTVKPNMTYYPYNILLDILFPISSASVQK